MLETSSGLDRSANFLQRAIFRKAKLPLRSIDPLRSSDIDSRASSGLEDVGRMKWPTLSDVPILFFSELLVNGANVP